MNTKNTKTHSLVHNETNPNITRNSYVPYTGRPYIDDNGIYVNRHSWTRHNPTEHRYRSIIYPNLANKMEKEDQPDPIMVNHFPNRVLEQNQIRRDASVPDKMIYDTYYSNCNYSANNLFR